MSEFLKRILVALIFGPVILAGLWLGEWFLFALSVAVSFGLIVEFKRVTAIKLPLFEYCIIFLLSVFWLLGVAIRYNLSTELLISSVLILFLSELLFQKINGSLERLSIALFLFVYSGILLSSFVFVRHFGRFWAILPVAMVWTVDTFAYWGGSLMGKRKLAPNVSPNKTIEGFFCGFLSGFVVGWIALRLYPEMNSLAVWFLAFIAGIVGQLGDLFESKLKRQFGIKDMSSLIPGHGGLWDRMDSLLWVYPLTWLMLVLLNI